MTLEQQDFERQCSELRELGRAIFAAHEHGDDVRQLLEQACDLEYPILGQCEIFGAIAEAWNLDA